MMNKKTNDSSFMFNISQKALDLTSGAFYY